jgi:glycosyltransferase involved in cell wall biosynthesis
MASELRIDHLCTFHGEVAPGKVPDFFSGLDVYVLASRKETFGVVVLEALASGIPVISTRCGGPEDIMIPSTGVMVDPENARSLSEAITFMLQNHDSYNRPEIRKYVLDHFGSKAFLGKMQTLYSEITSLPLTKQSS